MTTQSEKLEKKSLALLSHRNPTNMHAILLL